MLPGLKAAPSGLLVLFVLVLLLEVFTFLVLGRVSAVVRFLLLACLMIFTLNGSTFAKWVLLLFLFAGGAFLGITGVASPRPMSFTAIYNFLPALLLAVTGACLVLTTRNRTLSPK
jgi:hypothetical protein